jgi:hypothetical protein
LVTGQLTDPRARRAITDCYRVEEPGIRHLGPVAQDFRAAFGLGHDDNTSARSMRTVLHSIGRDVAAYAERYRQYFASHEQSANDRKTMVDPAPRVVRWCSIPSSACALWDEP